MMIYDMNGREQFLLIKEGIDVAETKRNLKKGIIDNHMILFTGDTGSGKSTGADFTAYKLWKQGWTIIYLTEKEQAEFDNAFCCFLPKKDIQHQYYFDDYERTKLIPQIVPVKLYHPFTFDIPYREKIAPINFFTFSLKNIEPNSFSAIMTGDIDKVTVKVCVATAQKLGENENLWEFVYKIHAKVDDLMENITFDYDEETMFVPVKPNVKQNTSSQIRDSMSIFRQHFMIQADNHYMNINMTNILNDNEHMHFFSTKWIRERNVKYFVILQLLNEIMNAIGSRKVTKKICIVFEEVKTLLPDSDLASFESELALFAMRVLSRFRKFGMVIATTQNYFSTNKKFRESLSIRLFGKISLEDKQRFIKDFGFGNSEQNTLDSISKGEFIWLEDYNKTKSMGIIRIPMPPFAHAEVGEEFFKIYKEYYPEKCKDNLLLYKQMLDLRTEIESQRKSILKGVEKEMRERAYQKKLERQTKVTELQEQVTETKKDMKEKDNENLGREAWRLYNDSNEKETYQKWNAVARKLGKDHHTVRKYAEKYVINK